MYVYGICIIIYKDIYIYIYIYIYKYMNTYFSYIVDIPNMVFNPKSLIKIHKYLFNTN